MLPYYVSRKLRDWALALIRRPAALLAHCKRIVMDRLVRPLRAWRDERRSKP